MKKICVLLLVLVAGIAGCKKKVDVGSLQPAATKTIGKLTVVLLTKTGDLTQGQNEFVVEFKDAQGQPVDVGDVQLGSNMSMPSMAPMSGDAEITPTDQPGIYKVKSNFAMSGAWHFTISWNGSAGQGHTSFNSNVR